MHRVLTGVVVAAVCAVVSGGVAIAAGSVNHRAATSNNPSLTRGPEPIAGPATVNSDPTPTFAPTPAQTVYVPIAPCRVVDTALHKHPIRAGGVRGFRVRGSGDLSAQGGSASGCGVPDTATAVAATVTTRDHPKKGTLKIWPGGTTVPAAIVASFAKKVQATSGATLTLSSPGAQPDIRAKAVGSATDVVIDITGYYTGQTHVIILADGTVWYGTDHLVSLTHTSGTGVYALAFDRSLAGCNALTTGNSQNNVGTSGSWGGSSLTVTTSLLSGGSYTTHDESFQVFIAC
jgi:hypothetical protein